MASSRPAGLPLGLSARSRHSSLPPNAGARKVETYHWRELPQVSFFVATKVLSRQTRVFVATKHVFVNVILSRQK